MTRHAQSPRPWPLAALCRLLALLLVIGPIPVAAQSGESMTGRVIESLEVRGLETIAPETILFYLDLEEGQVLDEVALNEKVRDLWSRQLIDDIRIDADPTPGGGVAMVLLVEERPTLRSVSYEGLKRVQQSDITDRILRENIQVLEGAPLSRGELERVKLVIEDLYEEKGYRFADATYSMEEVEPGQFQVTYSVDEGDRVRIAEVEFTGNEVISDLRLQWVMKKTRETNLINRIAKKDVYNPANLEEDLQAVRDAYRQKGYKNVVVGEPELDVVAVNPNAPPDKIKRRMNIEIPIYEGERWRLGEISIEGNEKFSDQNLLNAFEHRNDTWLKAKKLDESMETLNDVYQNSGFIFARVEPELRERPGGDNIVDLIVHVEEGDHYTIRRIEFEGNTRTRDKVLRRELRVQEGFTMNTGALRNSVFKVNQLGYFQLEQEEPVAIDVDNDAKKVDLVFKGTEADRTELQFGGGWSEVYGFEGQFALKTQNFLGRGETLSAQYQQGRFRDLVDFSYFVPWFLDKPQTIGVRVFDLSYNRFFGSDSDVQQQQQGVSLTYGRSLGLYQQFTMGYTRSEYNDQFLQGVDDDNNPIFLPFERSFSAFTPTWVRDSRDSRFEPTRGQRYLASVQVAGNFLGGDTELIKPQLQYSLFRPLSRVPITTVFALNMAGGYVELGEDSLISPLDRFFLGGERSVRGHALNTISARGPDGELLFDPRPGFGAVPLGGDSFFQANLEYHMLLGGPLRLLVFYDVGNVYTSDQTFDPLDVRQTTGLEMRLLLPVFGAPLRFIYAFNLDELPEDRFESFQFNIGTTF